MPKHMLNRGDIATASKGPGGESVPKTMERQSSRKAGHAGYIVKGLGRSVEL
jgi:hypothetical protein